MLTTKKRVSVIVLAAAAVAATLALVYVAGAPSDLDTTLMAQPPVAATGTDQPDPHADRGGPAAAAPRPAPALATTTPPPDRTGPGKAAPKPIEPTNPGTQTRTITHGPYTVPAAVGDKDGRTKNKIELGIETPCGDCFITAIKPDLVYADGSEANVDTGPGLHHFLLTNQLRADPICGRSLPNPSVFLGERFAAAGNERTEIAFPAGYGYYNDLLHRWNMASDFMNHAEEPKTVYIKITYEYVPGNRELKRLTPVWLDVAPCSSILDTYEVPAGGSTQVWDWEVNVPGRVIGLGGHSHNGGVTVKATNLDTGEVICDSVVRYGETARYVNIHGEKEVSSLRKCAGTPLTTVRKGQTVRLSSTYRTTKPIPDAMGIMVTYIERVD